MQVTAIELLVYADSLERLRTSDFSNADKRRIAEEIMHSFPQPQYCVHSLQTRLIVASRYEDFINGFKTKETPPEKPKQSRKRKTPTKSPKK